MQPERYDMPMNLSAQDLSATKSLFEDSINGLKTDMSELKTDVAELKTDVAVLKTDVAELKQDMAVVKTDLNDLTINCAKSF